MRKFYYSVLFVLTAHVPLYLCLWVAKQFSFNLKKLSEFVDASVHLDVGWYLNISQRGYWIDPLRADQSTAFFPLLPFLLRGTQWLLNAVGFSVGIDLVGFILARLFFCGLALCVGWYWKWYSERNGDVFRFQDALAFVFFFFCQPSLVFFAVPYTESLFAILMTITFIWLRDAKWVPGLILSGILLGFLLVLCRPTGIFFSLPVFALLTLFLFHRNIFQVYSGSRLTSTLDGMPLRLQGFARRIGGVLLDCTMHSKAMWRHYLILGLGLVVGLVTLLVMQFLFVGDALSFLHVRAAGWKETPGLENLAPFLGLQLGGMHTFRIIFVSLFVVGLCAAYKQGYRFEAFLSGLILGLSLYQGKAGDIVRYVGVSVPVWASFFAYAQKRILLLIFCLFIFSTGCLYFFLHWLNRVWVG